VGFGIRKWGGFDVGEEMEECVFHGVELHGSQTVRGFSCWCFSLVQDSGRNCGGEGSGNFDNMIWRWGASAI
jgi:hypothetical protein